MNKQEAMLILQALRPNDFHLKDPAISDALALAEQDPELKAWWQAQQEFDRKVVAKLAEIPIPDDLRATISAGNKIEKFTPPPSYSFWLAAAAAVAILCVAGSVHYSQLYGRERKAEYVASVLPLLGNDSPQLGMTSDNRDKVMAWLKERSAPLGQMPTKMASLPVIGCQKYQMHGHPVTLVCFAMADGSVAHLFMVEREALIDPPSDNAPEINGYDHWTTAAWSDSRMSYVLATQASEGELRKLL